VCSILFFTKIDIYKLILNKFENIFLNQIKQGAAVVDHKPLKVLFIKNIET